VAESGRGEAGAVVSAAVHHVGLEQPGGAHVHATRACGASLSSARHADKWIARRSQVVRGLCSA
jgi:hypothetical protein